jgi:NAD(P)H-hydrate epimerase
VVVFAGKGHNGGDAFVAARNLRETSRREAADRWRVEVRLAFARESLRPLAAKKLRELEALGVHFAAIEAPLPPASNTSRQPHPAILLDGILGIGAQPPLEGPAADACRCMNRLRASGGAVTVAVDVPTGVDATSGAADAAAVVADHTITVAFPKSGLLADRATAHVGRLHVTRLAELEMDAPPGEAQRDFILVPQVVREFLPAVRSFDMHKGQAGRVGIIGGSLGCVGAARMASAAAVRAGAGLVTLFVPEKVMGAAAAACIPEVMVRTLDEVSEFPAQAWGIGPGLGIEGLDRLLSAMAADARAAVWDADALNWLAAQPQRLTMAGPRLLTPHPGEIERLSPGILTNSRAAAARQFVSDRGGTLLLKGSRSVIAENGRPLAFNTTGTPGMATGGMGDVLTGMCAAFLAQGLEPFAAACLGSWMLGRAAEMACEKLDAPEPLAARDVLHHLGACFCELRCAES